MNLEKLEKEISKLTTEACKEIFWCGERKLPLLLATRIRERLVKNLVKVTENFVKEQNTKGV